MNTQTTYRSVFQLLGVVAALIALLLLFGIVFPLAVQADTLATAPRTLISIDLTSYPIAIVA